VKKLLQVLVLGLSLLAVTKTPTVQAATPKGYYAIQFVPTKDQINKQASYFDLPTVSGQTHDLKVLVRNIGNKDLTIKLQLTNGYTNNSGRIAYDQPDKQLLGKKSGLPNMVQGKHLQTVRVKAGDTKPITFKIKTPKLSGSGIYAGAILSSAHIGADSNKSVVLKNVVQFATGVVLHYGDDKIMPKFSIDKPKANKKHVSFRLVNSAPMNAQYLSFKGTLTRGKTKVATFNEDNYSMAPLSSMRVPVDVVKLTPGKYTLAVNGKTKSGAILKDSLTFTITQAQLDGTKQGPKSHNYWWWIIGGLIVLAIIIEEIIRRRRPHHVPKHAK